MQGLRCLVCLAAALFLCSGITSGISVNQCNPGESSVSPFPCPGPNGTKFACPRCGDQYCPCPDLPSDSLCSLKGFCSNSLPACVPCLCEQGWVGPTCGEPFETSAANKVVSTVMIIGVFCAAAFVGPFTLVSFIPSIGRICKRESSDSE